jgi:hypothetical protein
MAATGAVGPAGGFGEAFGEGVDPVLVATDAGARVVLLLFGEDGLEAVTLVAVPIDDDVVFVEVGDGSAFGFVSSRACVMVKPSVRCTSVAR